LSIFENRLIGQREFAEPGRAAVHFQLIFYEVAAGYGINRHSRHPV
jgi:hypothetical protein